MVQKSRICVLENFSKIVSIYIWLSLSSQWIFEIVFLNLFCIDTNVVQRTPRGSYGEIFFGSLKNFVISEFLKFFLNLFCIDTKVVCLCKPQTGPADAPRELWQKVFY